MLDNDTLGAKGESRFEELCHDAGLVPNKSLRDRTGWDFIVEFKPNGDDVEKRGPAPSCHVQVKTIRATTEWKVKVRLSAAERLAKELKPSFIVVLKVDSALDFVDARLIHLLSDNLAVILKRLRIEETKGTKDINQKWITLDADKMGESLPIDGQALIGALSKHCGTEPGKYVQHKSDQLGKLGYAPRALNITLQGKGDLADVFLGLGGAEITHLEEIETRFGIERRQVRDVNTIDRAFNIKPRPVEEVTITFLPEGAQRPVPITAELFLPVHPGLPRESVKYLYRSLFFDFFVGLDGTTKINAREDDTIEKLTIAQWISYFQMLEIIHGRKGEIRIQGKKSPSLTLAPPFGGPSGELDNLRYDRELFEAARHLLEASGTPDGEISSREVYARERDIMQAHALLTAATTLSIIENDSRANEIVASLDREMLFACGVELFGNMLACGAAVTMKQREEGSGFVSTSKRQLGIRVVRDQNDYEAFVKKAVDALGNEHKFVLPLPQRPDSGQPLTTGPGEQA